MQINTSRAATWLFSIVACLTLLGCATTFVAQRTSFVPSYKLTSAHVVWVDNPSFSYRIIHSNVIKDPHKTYAKNTVAQLLAKFEKAVGSNTQNKLASNNVNDGNAIALQMTPITAGIVMGGPNNLTVKVSLIKAHGSEELWSAEIKASGQSFLVEDPAMPEKMLEDFTTTVIAELRSAGWLNRSGVDGK